MEVKIVGRYDNGNYLVHEASNYYDLWIVLKDDFNKSYEEIGDKIYRKVGVINGSENA